MRITVMRAGEYSSYSNIYTRPRSKVQYSAGEREKRHANGSDPISEARLSADRTHRYLLFS